MEDVIKKLATAVRRPEFPTLDLPQIMKALQEKGLTLSVGSSLD